MLLFDAANTLIHKPQLFDKASNVLRKHGFAVDNSVLRQRHRLVSEFITFPDRTDKEFYSRFNSEWLYALGIIPQQQVLQDLFEACSYLPWEKFEDTEILSKIELPKSVLSNFKGSLAGMMDEMFPSVFTHVVVSENESFRKPDTRFYELAIEKLKLEPQEIIYVGDSLKLDMEPAQSLGMRAYLIDRNGDFPNFKNRLSSLDELLKLI